MNERSKNEIAGGEGGGEKKEKEKKERKIVQTTVRVELFKSH